jgi:carbohydrate-selective porin OprB
MSGGAGGGITFGPSSPIRVDVAYLAPQQEAQNPEAGNGVFNGSYAALGQLTFQPIDQLKIAGTFLHGYGVSPAGGDGSFYANSPFGDNPYYVISGDTDTIFNNAAADSTTSSNAYYVSAQFRLTDAITVGGFGGYTNAIDEDNLGAGRRELWTYAGAVTFNDIGKEGNELGLIFGMPSRNRSGPVGGVRDTDTSFHAEAYFKYQVTENISIIPGAFVILNPEHNSDNDDIYVGTIQTRFTF